MQLDINKIVRMDYGKETLYMHLMAEGFPMWEQWNKERASKGLSPVFHNTGVILFSQNGKFSSYEVDSMKSLREAGYGHVIEELRTPASIVERYPQFKEATENGFDIAYVNKAGGKFTSKRINKCVDWNLNKVGVTQVKLSNTFTASVSRTAYISLSDPSKVLLKRFNSIKRTLQRSLVSKQRMERFTRVIWSSWQLAPGLLDSLILEAELLPLDKP